MARLSFAAENKKEKPDFFPRLKLTLGENARIICLEDPEYGYVHQFNKPEMINGRPKMKTITFKNGDEKQVNAMEWIGGGLCLGDLETVAEKGVDPDNCVACMASTKSDSIYPPKRRFAMHVAKYALKGSSGWTVASPFSVEIVAWTFGDDIFNQLTDFATEFGPLLKHDLLLGPCENKDFQKFKIMPSQSAVYLESEDNKNRLKETFSNNKSDDIASLVARRVTSEQMSDWVEEVKARWRLVNGEPSAPSALSASLEDGLDSLDESGSETATGDSKAGETYNLEDLDSLLA